MGSCRAFALLLVLVPGLALAQSPKEKQKAGELAKQAIAKSQAGDHEGSVELYLKAYDIIPQPLLLSNVGSEYQAMDKPVEALKYFCKYLDADGPNGQNAAYVTAQAKLLYIKLGGITDVKDEDVCKPIVKPTPKEPEKIIVHEKAQEPVDHGPTTKTSPLRYVGVAVAVAGAGMFGFGVYEGLQAKSISDEITNHPIDQPWDSNIKAREQEGKDAEKKQIIFMAAGGGALAVGAVMFFVFAPKTVAEETVTFAPVATPDSFGFAAAGRF
jgi:tetratricopeptide (TPR) repeat protein